MCSSIQRRTDKVPCGVMDVPRNRDAADDPHESGEGSRVAVRMSEIVRELIDVHHCDPQEVAIEIGATKDESDLLRTSPIIAIARRVSEGNRQACRYGGLSIP